MPPNVCLASRSELRAICFTVRSAESTRCTPEWSYMFIKVDVTEFGPDYLLVTEGMSGKGITEDIDSMLTSAIDRFENTSG